MLRQLDLAERAGVSRATIEALENGRAAEIGFTRLARILATLGLGLEIHKSSDGNAVSRRRPVSAVAHEHSRPGGQDSPRHYAQKKRLERKSPVRS